MRSGQRLETPFVSIYAARSKAPEVACVVGKRVHAHAVVRHRYQRLLREAARALTAQLPTPHDMVWVAKPEILRVQKLQELYQSLAPYLEQLTSNSKRKSQKSK